VIEAEDRFRGCLLGLAVGDAVGTTLEFKSPGSFEPISDMLGGGPFDLGPGEWTDDTSMALCLAASLVYAKGFNAVDQMNRYCNWVDFGYMSSNGRCFDIGNTVARALSDYRALGEPFAGPVDPSTAGNGSIMRLAPVVMYFHPRRDLILKYAGESSRTTHGAVECVEACQILAELLHRALSGAPRDLILSPIDRTFSTEGLQSIANLDFLARPRSAIHGTGYVVRSLEAAVWCFGETHTFRDAILLAANLGDDADTTAAVCGQLAGAHYGASGIPTTWLSRLVMHEEMTALADQLREAAD
jgi:ADP-ribosyl-[dinitrogen reductase] hydrolase